MIQLGKFLDSRIKFNKNLTSLQPIQALLKYPPKVFFFLQLVLTIFFLFLSVESNTD